MTRLDLLKTTCTAALAIGATTASAQVATPAPTAAAPEQPERQATQATQSSGDSLGDIVVSARRRTETLQNVPIAITAFSSQTIAREGIQNIADVAKLTPSLMFDKYFSPQDNRPTIRGLPSTRGRPPVAVLVDGIDTTTESIATSGGGNLMDLRLIDFDRIEVVKGPQSALYGRSAFGGAINYITKEPGDRLGGYVSGELGLYGRYEGRAAIDVPVSDTLSFRVNGVYSKFGGFWRNSVTGNKLGGYRDVGGGLAAKWTPTPTLKIVGRVIYGDDHEEQQPTKYYGAADGLTVPLALPANVVGQKVGSGVLPATINAYRFGYIENENVPITLSPDPADPTGKSDYPGAHTYNLVASLHADWDVGPATLQSITGYVHSTGSTVADVDYFGRAYTQVALPSPGGLGEYSGSSANNGFWQFDIHTQIEQFSQEVRFGNLGSHDRFRWAVGELYWAEKVNQDDRRFSSFGLGTGASVSLDVALQGGRATVAAYQGRITHHYSGYAVAEFDILPTLTASLEGRYAKEKLDYVFGPSVALRSGVNLASGPAGFFLTGVSSTASSKTTYFTPRGILSWKPSQDVMIYTSAARGIKPGGFTQVGSADPNLGKYRAEHLSNYEIGAKTTLFNRRLRFNVDYFHMDYTNKQTATLINVPLSVAPTGSLSVTTNAGGAKVDGEEVEIAGLVTPELTLSLNYTHLVPKYTDYVYNSTTSLTIARAGNCTIITVGATQTCQITQTGNDLEMAPRHSGSFSANYTHDIGNGTKAFLEGDVQYRGKRTVFEDGHWLFHPYALVNVRLGIDTPKFNFTVYVDNVTNNQTIKSAINLLDIAAGSSSWLNMIAYVPDPRTAGVRFKYNF